MYGKHFFSVFLAVCTLTFSAASVPGQEDAIVVTIGEDRAFSDFNNHTAEFVNLAPLPLPDEREAHSLGNTAFVRLLARAGYSGEARAGVGISFHPDLGQYTWDQVKIWPVEVTVDFSYEISSNWIQGTGYATASVSIMDVYEVNAVGHVSGEWGPGEPGKDNDTFNKTYLVELKDLVRADGEGEITVSVLSQAYFDEGLPQALSTGANESSAKLEVQGIRIHFLPFPLTDPTLGTSTSEPDAYEEDDTPAQARVLYGGYDVESQHHSFHDTADGDWVEFEAESGDAVCISNQGSHAYPVLQIYDTDGITMLADSEMEGFPLTDSFCVTYPFTTGKTYYARVRNWIPNAFGVNATYDLSLIPIWPFAAIPSSIEGIVFDSDSGKPLEGVNIKTNYPEDGYRDALSLPTGDYFLPHPAGTFTLSAEAPGYETFTDTIILPESVTVIKHIAMVSSSESNSACRLGGTGEGSDIRGDINSARCILFTLSLNRQLPADTDGRLYVGLEIPDLLPGYMWFRPSDSRVPPYAVLVRDQNGFIPGTSEYYYSQDIPDVEDLRFEIGGLDGLKGLTIAFATWGVEGGPDFSQTGLKLIQRIEVSFR